MSYYIIIFKNTLDAMNGERILKENNYTFKMMPTPTSITQSCGICIRVEEEKIIKEIIDKELIIYKKIYIKEDNKFVEVN